MNYMNKDKPQCDIAIIGGGPAGMLAAIAARMNTKANVILVEKNPTVGVKLLLTGKGRCNITNTRPIKETVQVFGKQGSFFYGPLARFSNQDLINFLESLNVPTKIEGGGRVFPLDNKATSVVEALRKKVRGVGAKILMNKQVLKIKGGQDGFNILMPKKVSIKCQKVIIATGGKSYSATGSSGDGYRFAEELGHTIVEPSPALAPLLVKDKTIRSLAGLDLDNVKLTVTVGGQERLNRFGDMIFTHQGISGPIILDISRHIHQLTKIGLPIIAHINLKPSLDDSALKKRIYRDIHQNSQKEYQTLLAGLLPKSLITTAIIKTNIDEHAKNGQLTPEQISRLTNFLRDFNFIIDGTAPIEAGIITAGGVELDEIDSTNMESKLVSGLYFAGEVINLHGPTGGFNLQQAFSTGWLAGYSAGQSLLSDQ